MATRGSTQREGTTSDGASLDRLGGSLDAAQDALKDFRRELSTGGRDARKNLRGARRTLLKDLDEMQKARRGLFIEALKARERALAEEVGLLPREARARG